MKEIVKSSCSLALFLFLLLSNHQLSAQSAPVYDSPAARQWADSVLNNLSYQQKIGQLFMMDAFSNRDAIQIAQIKSLIDSFAIGGLIFFQGGPIREALLTNYYQSISKTPLMIGMDAEWGISMRLDSTIRFPRQMTLSAGSNSQQVYQMGKEIGRQCKRMGIHVNFAPSVDINNNPLNPVINSRSFGEDRDQVALLGGMYMKGMQDVGVLACGKHFPGHGNTDTDSHLTLPTVLSNRAELDTMELVPFQKLINDSLASVMVAHLFVPALDSTTNQASTLSPYIVTDLLKHKLGFNGLIFTDALNMKGVASYYGPGEIEFKALLAGNDVLLYSENIRKAIDRIHIGIQNCEIEQSDIDSHVRKILMSKYWVGLNKFIPIDTTNLYNDLNTNEANWLNYQMYDESITLLRNKGNLIPLKTFYRDCIASVVINDTVQNNFQLMLNRYAKVDCFSIAKDASIKTMDSLMLKLEDYDRVIISIHNTSINATKNFNITENIKYFTSVMAHEKNSILCVFGNPYVLGKLDELNHMPSVILAYEDTYLPQFLTAQKIFGAKIFEGKVPVSPSSTFARGNGLSPSGTGLLKYTLPEEEGIASVKLAKIDSIIQKSIRDSVFPGCQILIALKGNVIYDKSFGWHTYDHKHVVKNTDLYDIASCTKMFASALATMLLVDKKKIDPEAKISKYLPELKHSNKKDLTVRTILAHQGGLLAWIPFWKNTVDSNGLSTNYYRKFSENNFTTRVADSLFIRDDYPDSIWAKIIDSPLETQGKYVYSDLDLIIMQHIIEKVSGKSLDEFVEDNFYTPLGLWQTGFKPTERFDTSIIIPTENDTLFRRQVIQGYVHDPAAAMLGGVAGHAGIFSNAQALAVIMQLFLNDGVHAGKRYIKSETIDAFTRQAFPATENRRGMIFDKPEPDVTKPGPTAASASPMTFGHNGFTGTCAWADPQNGLVYVFLSNRVFPNAGNNKLAKLNIRTDIMQVMYDALLLEKK